MPFEKQGNFTFDHANQQDDLYKSMTSAQIKEAFDSRANELKTTLNKLIDQLQSTAAGDSAAHLIKTAPLEGVDGTTLYEVLQELRLRINSAVAGTIPDGSIGPEKLNFEIATDAASTSIADTAGHFASTNVEGALDELFTSANSVKTNVSGAIGSPATANDTGATLAGYINTEKGKIASNIGDGTSGSALQFLVDRLLVRLDDLATAVNSKNVPATSADTLAQLVTKVNQITTGKKYATGTIGTLGTAIHNVTSLSFKPSTVKFYASTDGYGNGIASRILVNGIESAMKDPALTNSNFPQVNAFLANGFSIYPPGGLNSCIWEAYE